MAKPILIKETPITMSELRQELDKVKKRDGELNFRANKTEDYLNQFATLKQKQTEELKQKIEKLNITRLKPEYVTKIVDLLPKTVEELKVVMQGYPLSVKQEDLKKIVDVINKHGNA